MKTTYDDDEVLMDEVTGNLEVALDHLPARGQWIQLWMLTRLGSRTPVHTWDGRPNRVGRDIPPPIYVYADIKAELWTGREFLITFGGRTLHKWTIDLEEIYDPVQA